jgi:septum formation topological specificity factor MinE
VYEALTAEVARLRAELAAANERADKAEWRLQRLREEVYGTDILRGDAEKEDKP